MHWAFDNVTQIFEFFTPYPLSMFAKNLSYLLDVEISQERSSDEQKVGSDPPNNYQQTLA